MWCTCSCRIRGKGTGQAARHGRGAAQLGHSVEGQQDVAGDDSKEGARDGGGARKPELLVSCEWISLISA